jgi:hypothetical protein
MRVKPEVIALLLGTTTWLLAATALVAEPPATGPAGATFANDQKDFTLIAPPGWTRMAPSHDVPHLVLLGPKVDGKDQAALRVQVGRPQPGKPQMPLDEFVASLLKSLGASPTEVKVETTKLNGADARRFVVTTDDNGTKVDLLHVVAPRDGKMFLFVYIQAHAEFDAAPAMQMFESLRWSR